MTFICAIILAVLASLPAPIAATTPGVGPEPLSTGNAVQAGASLAPALLGGVATWYVDAKHHPHGGLYAAAGPSLRHGEWRGSLVRVTSGGRSVTVRLTDFCACGDRNGIPTILDLSADAFRKLAPLSRGIVAVEVEPGIALPSLPPTDTAP